jgi:hypothetical protein
MGVVRSRLIPTNRLPVTLFRPPKVQLRSRLGEGGVTHLPTTALMRLSLSISLFNAPPPVQERHRNDDNSVNDSSASLGICTTDNIDCRSVIKVTPAILPRNVPRPSRILVPPEKLIRKPDRQWRLSAYIRVLPNLKVRTKLHASLYHKNQSPSAICPLRSPPPGF